MEEADQVEVSRILCDCYRDMVRTEGLSQDAVGFLLEKRGSLETVRRESSEQTYLVAVTDLAVIGIVAVDGNAVTKLYVDPPHQGVGAGRALFEAAEQLIRATGHDHLTLGSAPGAVGFYLAMGAAVTGRKAIAGGPLEGHRVFLMRKRLDPQ